MRVGVVGYGVVGRRVVVNLASRPEVDAILLHTDGRCRDRRSEGGAGRRQRTVRAESAMSWSWPRLTLNTMPALVVPRQRGGRRHHQRRRGRRRGPAHPGATRRRREAAPSSSAPPRRPGLTGLLARLAADDLDTVDEIHVAIHGTGGPACARQHHDALGSASRVWYDGAWQERPGGTGRELCWFPDPIGAHDCYRAALPDPILLHRGFPGAQRITARIDRDPSRPPDRPAADAATTSPRGPGRRACGSRSGAPLGQPRSATILGVAAPLGAVAGETAAICAAAARRGCLPTGLVVPGQAGLPTTDLLRQLAEAGLTVHRFVGTASQTSW